MMAMDKDGNRLLWNTAAQKMFGYSAEEMIGNNASKFMPASNREDLGHFIEHLRAGHVIHSIPDVRRRRDGTTIEVRISGSAFYASGELAGFIGIMEDATKLNTTERQLVHAQKMEAIGALTGGMAHDFNNLLGIIIGNLDLVGPILESNEDAQSIVADALDAALRGAELTRRLLAFARRQPLQPASISVNDLISDVTKLLQRTLGTDITVRLDLNGNLWNTLADPAQLEASLINLATNARDAMPKGGKLTITTRNCEVPATDFGMTVGLKPGDYVSIEVTDTGAGMNPEVIDHIFEPFFTTKDRAKGTGLGLSMVFGFINQSGGHISVDSEPEKGTTFRLYLPRMIGTAAVAPQPEAQTYDMGKGETVLVVEDNDALRRTVVRQLTELDYKVIEADNASVALKSLVEAKVDVVFTDIVMPGEADGIDLAHAVSETWPDTKVLLTSGFPESKVSGDRGALNASIKLLNKPYRKSDLARALREMLAA